MNSVYRGFTFSCWGGGGGGGVWLGAGVTQRVGWYGGIIQNKNAAKLSLNLNFYFIAHNIDFSACPGGRFLVEAFSFLRTGGGG